jgi:anthranilate/para-aminobenzoate synthase component I
VGGGIVVDSDAASELAETNAKAVAFTQLWDR